jgi:hypothetical protein
VDLTIDDEGGTEVLVKGAVGEREVVLSSPVARTYLASTKRNSRVFLRRREGVLFFHLENLGRGTVKTNKHTEAVVGELGLEKMARIKHACPFGRFFYIFSIILQKYTTV